MYSIYATLIENPILTNFRVTYIINNNTFTQLLAQTAVFVTFSGAF